MSQVTIRKIVLELYLQSEMGSRWQSEQPEDLRQVNHPPPPPPSHTLTLGCPQNNHFFLFEPKQTETHSVSVVFRFVSRNQKTFFRFVSVFRTSIETTETNRILSKQTEKISKKRSLLWGPQDR